MGIRKGCVVDTSRVVGELSGLVVIFVVTAMDVAIGAAVVRKVKVSVGVVLSAVTVVSMAGGCDVVMFLGVVS